MQLLPLRYVDMHRCKHNLNEAVHGGELLLVFADLLSLANREQIFKKHLRIPKFGSVKLQCGSVIT